MLRRVLALFDRYAQVHLRAEAPGRPLADAAGRPVGEVRSVRLKGDRLVVSGWARAGRVTLRGGTAEASGRPRRLGPDSGPSPDADDPARDCAFDLDLRRPAPGEALSLALAPEGEGGDPARPATLVFDLALPSAARARLGLWPGFAWRLARLAPDALRWQLSRDLRHRARVKRMLGLHDAGHVPTLDPGQVAPRAAPATGPGVPITIVLPVHDAFDLLPEVLGRVEAHTDLPWSLLAIDDASPDPRVRPFLRDWARARADRVELIENDRNLGFIGSVNRGLARALEVGHHVVLLNSDALVPQAWASRLLAPLVADARVASVTPLSNDAEIFSVPAICARLPLAPGQADAIDAWARRLDPGAAAASAPTGVGFCMAVSIDHLRRLPALDSAFGRGYGEEVDWCQKARGLGGRHLGQGALFVEHRGGASFGSEAKRRLVAANNALVARRYPSYDGEVQAFVADDPLATPRLLLGLAWAGAWSEARAAGGEAAGADDALVPVYLAHTLGGGAEMVLGRRMAADLARDGRPSVVIRVGGPRRWQVELVAPSGTTRGATDDEDLLHRLMAPLGRRRVVYSCGVGDPDPAALPALLLRLRAEAAAAGRLEVELHDFFPVSPSYTLLDSRGHFRGPVAPGLNDADPAHAARRAGGGRLGLEGWQAAWRPLLEAADEVVAFSDSSRHILLAAYPEVAGRVAVRPHAPLAAVAPAAPPAAGAPRVLGVLGNIGAQKGARLVCDLARLLPTAGRGRGRGGIARLVLVGNLDPAFALPRHAVVHGTYEPAELPALVARYGITEWLIPSIWPETFSFTTREALATGLPVHAFAIGAQGEAVAGAPNGRPLPWGEGPPDARRVLGLIAGTAPGAPSAA